MNRAIRHPRSTTPQSCFHHQPPGWMAARLVIALSAAFNFGASPLPLPHHHPGSVSHTRASGLELEPLGPRWCARGDTSLDHHLRRYHRLSVSSVFPIEATETAHWHCHWVRLRGGDGPFESVPAIPFQSDGTSSAITSLPLNSDPVAALINQEGLGRGLVGNPLVFNIVVSIADDIAAHAVRFKPSHIKTSLDHMVSWWSPSPARERARWVRWDC